MGDEIKEQGLEKEKTGLQCLPKTEYLKIVGRGRTIYSFYYLKCYVTLYGYAMLFNYRDIDWLIDFITIEWRLHWKMACLCTL